MDRISHDGVVAFSQTDLTENLKKITVPVLVMHSEDDQIVHYGAAGPLSAKLLKNGTMMTGLLPRPADSGGRAINACTPKGARLGFLARS